MINGVVLPTISVIIPVYNAERTLQRCVDSVLNSNYKQLEIILVDDGSTDGSGKMCDEYSSYDWRVKVFHKNNSGVSNARNYGLNLMGGGYVTFLDSDDYVNREYFDVFFSNVNEDIIFAEYCVNGIRPSDKCLLPASIVLNTKYETKDFLNKHLHFYYLRTPWAKFFKKDITAGVSFDVEMKLGEDTKYCLELYSRCQSLRVGNGAVYYYNDGGEQNIMKYETHISYSSKLLEKIMNVYIANGFDNSDFERVCFWIFTAWVSKLDIIEHPWDFWFNPTFRKYAKRIGINLFHYYLAQHPIRYYIKNMGICSRKWFQ